MLDMTSFDAALKAYYTNLRVANMVYQRNPFLAMVPKMESFQGKNLPIPIIYGNPQGRSATFSTARTNRTSTSKVEDFVLTRVKNYGVCEIDNETMEASMGDKGAFLRAATLEVDGILHSIARNLATDLYGNGSGNLGVVGSGQTTDTVTLSNISDITNFEVGMILKAGSSLTAPVEAGSVTIEAIDRTTGEITCTAATWNAVGAIPTIAAGMYLFVEGDAQNGGSSKKKVTGLSGWLDEAATSSSFFGVDRTVDLTRLAGNYYDGSADTVEEALIGAGMRLGREGGRPDYVFMNHQHYGELLKELGSKREYALTDLPKAQVSFKGVLVHTPNGTVTVIADQNASVGYAWMLQLDTWKLYSLNAAPRILNYDGNRWLRSAEADGVEVRAGYYAQLGCNAPGANCKIKLAT